MKKLLLSALFFATTLVGFAAGHTVTITTTTNVTCFGLCNGSVTANVSGGVGPFTYSWSPSGGTAATATGLCAGSYTVTVTDNSDASTATASVAVTQPANLSLTVGGGPVCAGGCSTMTPTGSGGTPFYTYNCSAGSLTVCPSGTTTYTITVSDANGCTANTVHTVSVTPTATVTPPANITVCDGGVVPMTSWGTTPGGSTCSWTNSDPLIGLGASGTGVSIPSFTATNTGTSPITATITITPVYSGCTGTPNTFTITVNPLPVISMPPSYSVCYGGAVSIGVSPTAGYTYSWIPSAALSASVISNPVCAPPTSISYTLSASYLGCTTAAATTVGVDNITATVSSTNNSTCGACDGTAIVTPSGGTAPFTYSWNTVPVQPYPTATGICAGTYSVLVTDAAGCTVSDSVTILQPNTVISDFTMVPDSSSAMTYWAFNSSTGTGLSYSWNFGDGGSSASASPTHTYSIAGPYNICLDIASPGGCTSTSCHSITVSSSPASCLALFNIGDDTTTTDPNAYTVYNLSYGSTLTYLWDFGDGATSTLQNPTHIYPAGGPYNLCLTVDNGSGCTQTFCDSLIYVDSLSRTANQLYITVVDGTPPSLVTVITDQISNASVNVYPNPFDAITTFEISGNGTETYSFEMTDVLGKKVQERKAISEKRFTVSRIGLENGIYFYKIYDNKEVIGKGKLIVR